MVKTETELGQQQAPSFVESWGLLKRAQAPVAPLGIMQGRLVPPEPERFQAFPRTDWANEFELAAQVPVSYIEWIFDVYGADVNPLSNKSQLPRLRALINNTGVAVRSICADYFMERSFLRCTATECEQRESDLHTLLITAGAIGIQRIVLPFVDASRMETNEDRQTAIRVLQNALPIANQAGVELHLETALDPGDFASLLNRVPDPMIKVNYDSGNSASLGYLPSEEFTAYGDRVGSVHIKDRVRGGGTVPLGSGDSDFAAVFAGMERVRYQGDLTLQVARPTACDEVAWAQKNRAFVASYWTLE